MGFIDRCTADLAERVDKNFSDSYKTKVKDLLYSQLVLTKLQMLIPVK